LHLTWCDVFVDPAAGSIDIGMVWSGENRYLAPDIKQEFDQYLKSADKMPSNLIRVGSWALADPA